MTSRTARNHFIPFAHSCSIYSPSVARIHACLRRLLLCLAFGMYFLLPQIAVAATESSCLAGFSDNSTSVNADLAPTQQRSQSRTLRAIEITAIVLDSDMVDANPRYLFPGASSDSRFERDNYLAASYLKSLTDNNTATIKKRLLQSTDTRLGLAADGASQVVIRLYSTVAGTFSVTAAPDDHFAGNVKLLWEGQTCIHDQQHVAFVLYRAPDDFGRGSGMKPPTNLIGDQLESRKLEIDFTFQAAKSRNTESASTNRNVLSTHTAELILARPPVVLIHGTFDDPISAWVSDSAYGDRFVDTLIDAGFKPFLVDYKTTNTAPFTTNRNVAWDGGNENLSWLGADADRSVITEQTHFGGIKAALEYYRSKLKLASTRADVIGHSMGGLLARVYASDNYNPDYLRVENLYLGDINRLITISTPHYGSEMAELTSFLTEPAFNRDLLIETQADALQGRGLVDNVSSKLQQLKLSWGAWWETGRHSGSSAMHDQTPQSPALKAIHTPQLPVHVIATTTDIGQLKDPVYDPDKTVLYRANVIAELFFQHPEVTARYLDEVLAKDWIEHSKETVFVSSRESFLDLLSSEAEHWATSPERDVNAKSWFQSRPLPELTLESIRKMVFRFDKNDTTVRLDSQLGGLQLNNAQHRAAISYFGIDERADRQESVIHGFAPRYYRLQLRAVDVLKSSIADSYTTLGPAGQNMQPHTPELIGNSFRLTGSHAIAWSGMVPSHAEAFLDVAKQRNVIIMMRPVNPDATQLIVQGAATKGMNIKGKSSNWGPQKGYIPENQAFSKLWRTKTADARVAEIAKYNGLTRELLEAEDSKYRDPDTNLPLADIRQLEHRWPQRADSTQQNIYTVWYEQAENEALTDAEAALHLCKTDAGNATASDPCLCESWLDWRNDGSEFSLQLEPSSAKQPAACQSMHPLTVLADNTRPDKPFLTADYDILTTGFYCPEGRNSQDPACTARVRFNPNDNKCSDSSAIVEASWQRGRRPDPMPCFDEQTGLITEAQKDLLDDINGAVAATGYSAGRVSHHGPETQFFKSPYVDYPITVFDPAYRVFNSDGSETTRAEIVVISRGPAGFRDIYLKRYYETKIDQGYWLYPNEDNATANWRWSVIEDRNGGWLGYNAVDDSSLKLNDDTEQIPPPRCVQRERRRQEKIRRGILQDIEPQECLF